MITWELLNSVISYSWFAYRTLPDIISKCRCTVLSVYGSSMPQNHFDPDGSEPSSNHIFWLLGHPRAEGGRPGGGAAVHSLFGTLIVGNLRILEQITFYLNGIFPLVTVFSISSDPVFIHCFIFAPKVADKSLSWHVGHVFFLHHLVNHICTVESCPWSPCNSIFGASPGRHRTGGPQVFHPQNTGVPWITFDGGLYCQLSILAVWYKSGDWGGCHKSTFWQALGGGSDVSKLLCIAQAAKGCQRATEIAGNELRSGNTAPNSPSEIPHSPHIHFSIFRVSNQVGSGSEARNLLWVIMILCVLLYAPWKAVV